MDELSQEESAVVDLVHEWVDREVRPAARELEHGNTNEIQRNIIARQLIKRHRVSS
jgi:alkylation response protein AidB-like acyl-CoA dehydrogenase